MIYLDVDVSIGSIDDAVEAEAVSTDVDIAVLAVDNSVFA